MSENNQDLTLTVKAKDEASGSLNRLHATIKDITSGVFLGNIAYNAATSALRGMGDAVTGSIGAWEEQENAIAQTNAVLQSTGGVIGMSSKELIDLSASLQKTTTYGHETILTAENLLLTFTNIGKDIFPAATQTVLDMSTALGQDLKSSAIQLGKALQDPILGVTALRRVGVNFNTTQTDIIKKLVETGHAAEAQKMIMKELATEFGGSATAAAKTFQGQMEQVKNKVNDVQETIGHGLTAALSNVVVAFNDTTGAMDSNVDASKQVFQAFAGTAEFTANLVVGIETLATGFVELTSYMAEGIGMLNGFDDAELKFWEDFRTSTAENNAAYVDFALNLHEKNNATLADWDNISTASNKAGKAGTGAFGDVGKAAADAAQKIKDANKAVEDTLQKIQDLTESNNDNNVTSEQNMADEIVKQQHKVHDMRIELEKNASSENRLVLQDQLGYEEAALNRMSSVKVALASQVAEAQRRFAETEFERNMEDAAKKIVDDNAAYNKKMVQLKQELKDNQYKRDQLGGIESQITATVVTESNARTSAVNKSVNDQINAYKRLQAAVDSTSHAGSSGSITNIMTGLPKTVKVAGSFAEGGTVPGVTGSPQLIVAHGGEQVIPVGKTASGITVNIYSPSVRNDSDLTAMKNLINDSLRGLMVDHKLTTV